MMMTKMSLMIFCCAFLRITCVLNLHIHSHHTEKGVEWLPVFSFCFDYISYSSRLQTHLSTSQPLPLPSALAVLIYFWEMTQTEIYLYFVLTRIASIVVRVPTYHLHIHRLDSLLVDFWSFLSEVVQKVRGALLGYFLWFLWTILVGFQKILLKILQKSGFKKLFEESAFKKSQWEKTCNGNILNFKIVDQLPEFISVEEKNMTWFLSSLEFITMDGPNRSDIEKFSLSLK